MRAISVYDNGGGVFPDRDRRAALRRIATTIGQSHKAHLSPAERHRQMTLGKYGIGLLGFWSVGKHLEIRSRVDGSDVWVLEMEEEQKEARLRKRRLGRLPLEPTMTEVVVTHINPIAAQQIRPRRLAAYLAGELRGQLLSRETTLEIFDRVARGRTQKRRVVKPRRYQGMHLLEISELPVPGYAGARLDLYLIPETEDRRGCVALACGGSTVLDDLAGLDGPEEPRAPWSTGRFEGVVDFPDLTVAPSRRRGLVPDESAQAFLAALLPLEERLVAVLAEDAERRRSELETDDAKRLRRLFRRLPRSLPDYAMFEVEGNDLPAGGGGAVAAGAELPEGRAEGGEVELVEDEQEPGTPETEYFYPPGPLATVEVRPRMSVLAIGGERRLKAVPLDGDGREVTAEVCYRWRLEGAGSIDADGERALYCAPDEKGEARALVIATSGDRSAESEGLIRIREATDLSGGPGAGIPDPEPFQAPTEGWRSRVLEGRWQYNTSHPDYVRVQDDRRLRLNYLVWLFAKELVLLNFGEPGDGRVLERLVQVLTHVEVAKKKR